MASIQPSSSPPGRGLLIVVEGLDRSGKTTQTTLLVERLMNNSRPATLQKFPDRTTPTGILINSYLTNQTQQDDHAIHLLFSSNRWEARSKILSLLESGTNVVVDRYSFSGAVYSAAKGREDLGVDWAWAMEVGLPRPDLIVFLDLDLTVQASRGGYGVERYELAEMQGRVRGLFKEVLGRVKTMGIEVAVVDAGVDVDQVAERVWGCVIEAGERLREREAKGEGEIGRLKALGS